MHRLGFGTDPTEDAKLAVSELATNAHTHTSSNGHVTTVPPELWIWARNRPDPELVVSVFDAHREIWPAARDADPLDEHGKGLSIVLALSADTGTHLTRSRLTAATGKCVWFTLALPTSWPPANRITPIAAASRLSEALRARGVPTSCRSDDRGISILSIRALNIRVDPKAFSWRNGGGYIRQPLIDLQETAERLVSHHETHHSSPAA